MKQKIKVIIFDFDATLYTGSVWGEWDKYIMRFLDSFFHYSKDKNEFLGEIFEANEYLDERKICKGMIAKYGTAQPLIDYLINEPYHYSASDLKFVDNEFLKNLAREHSLYIVSNSSSTSVVNALKENDIDTTFFKDIYYNYYEDKRTTKAKWYEIIKKQENVKSTEILVVGDNDGTDLAPAKDLEMKTFLVKKLEDIYDIDTIYLSKKEKNIIVVDMQKGFINKNNKHIVNKIKEYLSCNEFGNILFTKFINTADSQFVESLKWTGMIAEIEQDFVLEEPDAIILKKYGYGLTSEMIEEIKSRGITEIEVVGVDTDACVLAIAFNLFDNGIKPIIIPTLCASSSSKRLHKFALAIMRNQFGI